MKVRPRIIIGLLLALMSLMAQGQTYYNYDLYLMNKKDTVMAMKMVCPIAEAANTAKLIAGDCKLKPIYKRRTKSTQTKITVSHKQ